MIHIFHINKRFESLERVIDYQKESQDTIIKENIQLKKDNELLRKDNEDLKSEIVQMKNEHEELSKLCKDILVEYRAMNESLKTNKDREDKEKSIYSYF